MNHLPFDWSDDVDDGHVEAQFIGGIWDGKTYAIPSPVSEWRVAVLPIPKFKFINKPPDKLIQYDVAIYRRVVNGLYWFTRIEKADE
jgi:hypothetical protein